MSTEQVEILDAHLHAWPTDMNAMLTASEPATLDAKVYEDTLAQMDAVGISQAVISGPNNVTLEYCQRAPDRFIGFWMPNWTPFDPGEQAARFAQAVETQGFRGLGEIAMQYLGDPVNHERYFPLYRICEERHLPVFLHTGLDGRDFFGGLVPSFRVSLGNPLMLEGVAAACPALKIVMCHMGYPFTEQATCMLLVHSNVYMDVAGVNWGLGRAGFHRLLRQVVDTVGADKILFGTDQMAWPEQIPVAVSAIQEASFLSQEDKRKILSDNAQRLLGKTAVSAAE